MIENWNPASEEDKKFVQKERKWMVLFCTLACICVLPIGGLGIWQAYDIYASYVDGWSFGFILTSVLCAAAIFLALLFFVSSLKKYREIESGILYQSQGGQVKRVWQEKDGKSTVDYFGFDYKDLVTGEVKEHKGVNYGSKGDRMEAGDALHVLAYKREDAMEIVDVFKQHAKKKLEAFWLVLDAVILGAMLLASIFLYLDFGIASLYITLGIHLSIIAVAAVTFLFGIVERKVGAIAAALILGGFLLLIGTPDSLKNISRDMAEGPKEITAYVNPLQTETTTRTRRGRRRNRHYKLDISSEDMNIREVEVTRAAYEYYMEQRGGGSLSGKMIYYPNSGIFLYFVKSE